MAAARPAATRHMDNAIERIEQAEPAFWEQAEVRSARPRVSALPMRTGLD